MRRGERRFLDLDPRPPNLIDAQALPIIIQGATRDTTAVPGTSTMEGTSTTTENLTVTENVSQGIGTTIQQAEQDPPTSDLLNLQN